MIENDPATGGTYTPTTPTVKVSIGEEVKTVAKTVGTVVGGVIFAGGVVVGLILTWIF